LPVAVGGVLG
jgi:hypothetical protein